MTENDISVQGLEAMHEILKSRERQLAVKFDLPPTLAKVLALLVEYDHVTTEMIEALGIMKSAPKVPIMRLRKKLQPYNIQINANRTLGYWIDNGQRGLLQGV